MVESTDLEQLCEQGRDLIRAGRAAEALECFEQAAAIADEDPDAQDGLATANFLLGNFEAAVTHFTQVTRLDPRRGKAFVNLGAAYNRLGDYPKAVEALRRGLQMEKKCSEGFYNLGICYRKMKQWALAIPAYRQAIHLDPNMVEAYQNIGNVYLEMKNFQQAIVHFRKALEIRPEFERARRGLEKAEAAKLEAKSSINPFGRLVQESQAEMADEELDPKTFKPISETEREQDRQGLHKLAQGLQKYGQALLTVFKDQLDPGVRDLTKALAEQRQDPGALHTAYDSFMDADKKYAPLVKQLRQLMAQLREHESQMRV